MSVKLIYRYSNSLYEAAVAANNVSKVAQDCEGILALINETKELRVLFSSPVISKEKKMEIRTSYLH